mgnify:CR=1 FL=1
MIHKVHNILECIGKHSLIIRMQSKCQDSNSCHDHVIIECYVLTAHLTYNGTAEGLAQARSIKDKLIDKHMREFLFPV